jgi:hypothetical protein
MENVGLVNDHLEYLTAILVYLWQFGRFCGHLVHFSPFWYIAPRRMEGEQIISPPGDNFTPRGQNSPRGTTSPLGYTASPLGDNFAPGGQLRPWGTTSPLEVKVCP